MAHRRLFKSRRRAGLASLGLVSVQRDLDAGVPRVLVIEHEWDVDLGLIAGRLQVAELDVDIVGPDRKRAIPTDLAGYDGLIVLGGTMDPVDAAGYPYLPAVRELLRDAVDRQVPPMGVCLGAQLLGMALGGTARLIPTGPEVALTGIRPTAGASAGAVADPLIGPLAPEDRRSLAWHWWEVTDLPDAYRGQPIRVLAESDACPVQAFVVGASVYGIQFHLEALGDTAKAWVSDDPDRLRSIGVDPDRLLTDVRAAEAELRDNWFPVVDAWFGLL